ncbi:unnamed protein product [Vicia faba]|uniref:Uncharacterized protein n=1 Tax=Vicia faba TaxID=3906 RepID=A0AAV0YHY9_VICFA|nr:unnamed protein product [Vicia faba]
MTTITKGRSEFEISSTFFKSKNPNLDRLICWNLKLVFNKKQSNGSRVLDAVTLQNVLIDDDIKEIVGGINKKGSIFRLGSQAATIKEFLKSSSFISIDVSSDKVVAIEVKIEALTAELEKKNLEQEMIKQKIEHWERMFGSFMPNPNQNFPLQPEGEVDNENVEMSDGKL